MTSVEKTAAHVKKKFSGEASGHDWWHMYRVWQLSKYIARKEGGANTHIVELAALLHDIADFKFHDGDIEAGPRETRKWLKSIKEDEKTIDLVEDIVRNISFKGSNVKNNLRTLEGKIVHDADKLDAIGAIGIARVFTFTGAHGRPIYTPGEQAVSHSSLNEYIASKPSAITHFHEKLLLLKDRMLTKTGRQLAQRRHRYMEKFLEEFSREWTGQS